MQFPVQLGYSLGVRVRSKCLLVLFAILISSISAAQRRGLYLSGFSGQSVIVFGSSDPRRSAGVGLGYSFGNQAWLRWGKHHGELNVEAYYDFSKSTGIKAFPANTTSAYGVLAYSRYYWRPKDAPNSFFDLGWGAQFLSKPSHDLESKINSTPFFDFGIVMGKEHERALVGARFMHVSNAGTVGNNQGQNQIFFLVQIPF
jgi:hypothetical protein